MRCPNRDAVERRTLRVSDAGVEAEIDLVEEILGRGEAAVGVLAATVGDHIDRTRRARSGCRVRAQHIESEIG